MRIAVLTNAYPPNTRGGAGRIAALQVELLQAQGHQVRVWVSSLAWTVAPFWRRLLVHARDFFWIHPAAKEIIAWQPEVLLTHNLTGAGFRTPSTIQKHAIRWVHVLHDVQLFHPLGLLQDERPFTSLQRGVSWLRRVVFGRPEAVVSPTDWLLQAHTRRGWFEGSELVCIPNPAPPLQVPTKIEWNKKLKILYVSSHVSPEKGSDVLKELMQTAVRPIEWRLIGGGAAKVGAARLSEGSLLITQETLTPEEILKAMCDADILLVPSQIEENQPTVLLEAFACGLPVVAQAKGGIPETLGQASMVVRSSAPAEWWLAIEQLVVHTRASWVERERSAWQRHDPVRVVEALLVVLKSNKKI